jgi:hypothetical protein
MPLELLSAASLTHDSPCEDAAAAGADGTSTSSSSVSPVGLRRRLCAHHRRHPGRHSQRVITALREAFLRTDGDLAGTEVGEVVGTTAVVAVVGQREMFVAHCGEERVVVVMVMRAVAVWHPHMLPAHMRAPLTRRTALLLRCPPLLHTPPGDSRAVLCRSGAAIPLTHDHKPSRSDELVGLVTDALRRGSRC